MELNSVGSVNAYAEISGTGYSRHVQDNNASPFPANGEDMDISRPGKMMNAVSRMSEEEKSEMKAFHEELMEAVKNGTFDASEMAASAPESLVSLSEETGIDLEQMIEDMASGPQGKRGAPPPPMMGGIDDSELSEEEIAEMEAFHDEIMNAISNGSFDAAELAAEAPESMVEFAEENGLDLEQMIEWMAQGPQGPPPPPPMMYGADGKGIPFEDENEGELLSDLLLSDDTDTVEQS